MDRAEYCRGLGFACTLIEAAAGIHGERCQQFEYYQYLLIAINMSIDAVQCLRQQLNCGTYATTRRASAEVLPQNDLNMTHPFVAADTESGRCSAAGNTPSVALRAAYACSA